MGGDESVWLSFQSQRESICSLTSYDAAPLGCSLRGTPIYSRQLVGVHALGASLMLNPELLRIIMRGRQCCYYCYIHAFRKNMAAHALITENHRVTLSPTELIKTTRVILMCSPDTSWDYPDLQEFKLPSA